ncbi:MAG: hypothetical protein LBR81_08535 [Prevotellaceae bacterium]|jgi:hypothetical protein|nr:hypothetical protein [Prevotellaceae bacterium]
MRKINRFNIVLLAGFCIFCSCFRPNYHTITIAMDSTCTLEQQEIAYEVINKRIVSNWIIKEKTNLIDGKFDLNYSGQDSLLTQLLAQRGEIYITEMYRQDEIQSPRDRVYEKLFWLMENTNHEPLWQIEGYQIGSPDLVKVPLQQVAYIDSIFNSFQALFPAGISFAWTAKPTSEGFFDLLPLKSFRKLPLNPSTVKESNIRIHDGYQKLYIELNKEAAEEWARITRDNISRNLAIVMDGKVLMYPRVNAEITGGKMAISGNFNSDELLLIKSILLGGELGCKAQIVK